MLVRKCRKPLAKPSWASEDINDWYRQHALFGLHFCLGRPRPPKSAERHQPLAGSLFERASTVTMRGASDPVQRRLHYRHPRQPNGCGLK